MKIRIKRLDTALPLPEYHTSGAVAFDLSARVDMTIAPRSVARIPANIIVEVPPGHMLYIKDRSSLAVKKGLLATAGFIDQDYCGEKDEILFQVYNISDAPVAIGRGERLGQGVFIKIERAEWQEAQEMKKDSRGGFGSTG